MHPCGRNSFRQGWFCHADASHHGASSVLTLVDSELVGWGEELTDNEYTDRLTHALMARDALMDI